MAVIDVAGFVADVKSQAIDHGFHVHDERHFVETYSLRQLWEVDLLLMQETRFWFHTIEW